MPVYTIGTTQRKMEMSTLDTSCLIGKTIGRIYMDRNHLSFHTDGGCFTFEVIGKVPSCSHFVDFYGVANLFGATITGFEEVYLKPGEAGYRRKTFPRRTRRKQVHGYRLTTNRSEKPSVFSYRYEMKTGDAELRLVDDFRLEEEQCRVLHDVKM